MASLANEAGRLPSRDLASVLRTSGCATREHNRVVINFVNARLVTRLGSDWLLIGGTRAAAATSVALALAAAFGWGGLAGLVIPLFVFISATGFIVANSITGALVEFPAQAGAVSTLIGAIQYGSGILGSALVGALADGTPRPMGFIIALAGLGSLLCSRLLSSAHPVVLASGSPSVREATECS